tara:strand:- start:105 stop:782 length:678 start_codon:yes stop_codon:yes gene_type:complete
MWFQQNKLEVHSNRVPIHFLKNFICTYPKNLPSYFKNIPKTYPFLIGKIFNIRTCSGFLNFFKRSVVLKSPFDVTLEIRDKEIFCEFGSGAYMNEKNIGFHTAEQFLKYVDVNKYDMITKLMFGINIKCKSPVLVTNPWWSMNDFEIVPGILNAGVPIELNLFIPIKKNQTRIVIKQGTPVCMLHFESEKDVKLVFKEENINSKDYNGKDYLRSNLKNMVLKNKI